MSRICSVKGGVPLLVVSAMAHVDPIGPTKRYTAYVIRSLSSSCGFRAQLWGLGTSRSSILPYTCACSSATTPGPCFPSPSHLNDQWTMILDFHPVSAIIAIALTPSLRCPVVVYIKRSSAKLQVA